MYLTPPESIVQREKKIPRDSDIKRANSLADHSKLMRLQCLKSQLLI